MGFRKCRHDDPFTRRVRELYKANVVGAPRAGIDPLDVLAVRKRRVEPRGRLISFISDGNAIDWPLVTSHVTAGMSGLRSASLDVELGLTLTATFLNALGVPLPGAELNTSLWKGTSSLDFEVRDVEERQVDVGYLGRAVSGHKVDSRSPASAIFFGNNDVRMLIITRTLTSPHFAVRSTGTGGQSAGIAVDAIADLFGKVDVDVAWSRESTDVVSFRGATAVTFAFAAVPCVVRPDGSFLFGLEADQITLGTPAAGNAELARPIVDEDGLLSFDSI